MLLIAALCVGTVVGLVIMVTRLPGKGGQSDVAAEAKETDASKGDIDDVAMKAGQGGTSAAVSSGAVPVFILAGQTNMQGAGRVAQLRALIDDPTQGRQYAEWVDDRDDFLIRDDVWLVTPHASGPLTMGMGKSAETFGPALMIGSHLGEFYEKPVVLIRYTHGPWTLGKNGLPPTSRDPGGEAFQNFMSFVTDVKQNHGKYCPAVSGMKADVKGFFWLQGWNDMVDPKLASDYEMNLTRFFDSVRVREGKDLPIVFGELGQSGIQGRPEGGRESLQQRMIQTAQRSTAQKLDHTVLVGTSRFVRPDPPGRGYLYGEDARTFYDMGDAMGQAMVGLLRKTP